ncbi:MAG: hypothetical protein QMD23_08000, partial [Candidatus Bathyarchaeia archaeon]|nr:hypothetical protein [Candidatus Bathyarchaeia archaeon]
QPRHDMNTGYLYYRYDKPDLRIRAKEIINILDDYNIIYDLWHPLWRASETYPDEDSYLMPFTVPWQLNMDKVLADCAVFGNLPRELNHCPNWSMRCFCKAVNLPLYTI